MTDKIDQLLKEITELRNDVRISNQRMNTHIDFIETVFNIVRIPFFTIMDVISKALPSYPQLDDDTQ